MRKSLLPLITLMLMFSLAKAQSVEEYIAKAEESYKVFNHQDALAALKNAEKLDPNNWEVIWRLSRTYVDIAEKLPTETSEQEDKQESTFITAMDYADKAIKIAPEKSVSHLRRAIAGGKIALFKGVFSVADVVNKVRDDVEKAISLNNGSDFDQAVAHYVLARTHAKISEKWAPARSVLGLGWADLEIALQQYELALKRETNFTMIYVDYAIALIREDEYEKARKMLNKALECPLRDEDDPQRKAEAKELLKEIEDE
ncbi:MAG: hypothetical protein K9J12_04305 [Melioribacteraceae bacterium]|nr:hypothetical protein [Melioribacteraceae bacterium]MCF8265094.1 hypothetical protein [Melioribacteraceae bacterium]MCF8413213.1 hypothetical protein [Melioribacteraceae bacterium]MCF8431180.1 hypothetical protein [Melioribacteraceae bacterium]